MNCSYLFITAIILDSPTLAACVDNLALHFRYFWKRHNNVWTHVGNATKGLLAIVVG